MTDYLHSIVLIVPDEHRATLNAFGASMGLGDDNYTIPLSADGSAPATHWGLAGRARAGFAAILGGAAAPGYTPEQTDAIRDLLTAISIRPADQHGTHLDDVLGAQGMVPVLVTDPA